MIPLSCPTLEYANSALSSPLLSFHTFFLGVTYFISFPAPTAERPPGLGLRLNSLLAPGIFQVLAGVGPKLKSLFS